MTLRNISFSAILPLAALFGAFSPGLAEASRKLALTTLDASSIHGGTINTTACTSADMLKADNYISADGVYLAYHQYRFSFRNLSSEPQTVIVRVLPQTKITTSNSDGEFGITRQIGPSRTIASPSDLRVDLGAYDEGGTSVTFVGNAVQAVIQPMDPGIVCESPVPPPQVCLTINSQLVAEIEVLQDRGAVSGSVTMSSHRCHGHLDVMRTTPVNKDLNGGRPF